LASANDFTFRNRIINGDMRIDQRNAGASVTPTDGQYTLDRWVGFRSQASKFSVQRNAGAITPPVGFTNYLGVVSLSAYSSISTDYFAVSQSIEGLNVADLGWGTANAQTVTLSLWVRSSLTGTFAGALRNSGNTRCFCFTYTVSSANTWEYKTITIPGDTSGTWLATNGVGINLWFDLGSGSSLTGTAGAWSATQVVRTSGSVSVVGTSGATFYITGVQLEAGSVATPFERVDYGRARIMCQRYYRKSYNSSVAIAAVTYVGSLTVLSQQANRPFCSHTFNVSMRAAPTITLYNPLTGATGTSDWAGSAVTTQINDIGEESFTVWSSGSPGTHGGLFHYTAASEL
jgi:hypothetical protein